MNKFTMNIIVQIFVDIYLFFYIILFIYLFWLCWVFIAARAFL